MKESKQRKSRQKKAALTHGFRTPAFLPGARAKVDCLVLRRAEQRSGMNGILTVLDIQETTPKQS
jgi:hypothetical protein